MSVLLHPACRIFLWELWVRFPTSKTPILLLVSEELSKQMISCSKIPTWMFYFDKHRERCWGEMTESHWSSSQRQKWDEKRRPEGRHVASLPDSVRFHIWKHNPKFLCIYFCLLWKMRLSVRWVSLSENKQSRKSGWSAWYLGVWGMRNLGLAFLFLFKY